MKIKYTRYDLKRRRKSNITSFIILFTTMLCLIFLGGIFIKYYISNKNSDVDNPIKAEDTVENKDNAVSQEKEIIFTKGETVMYAAVQGGIFKNEDYAKETKSKLLPFGNAFIVNEDEFKRVVLGVYGDEESKKVMEGLAKENIESSRVVFKIVYDNVSDFQRAQIVNAYLQILNKLSEKNVKSIQTKELKTWVAALSDIDSKDKNIEKLNEIKNRINSLPEQISKENLEENYIFIYNYLKKAD